MKEILSKSRPAYFTGPKTKAKGNFWNCLQMLQSDQTLPGHVKSVHPNGVCGSIYCSLHKGNILSLRPHLFVFRLHLGAQREVWWNQILSLQCYLVIFCEGKHFKLGILLFFEQRKIGVKLILIPKNPKSPPHQTWPLHVLRTQR